MKSGWVTKKLGEVCESISTRGCQIQQSEICDIGEFPVVSQSEAFIEGYTDFENAIENIPVVLFGDHTCCVKYIDFPFVVGADGTKLLTSKQFEVKFLYYAILKLSSSLVDGKYRRHFKDLKKCDIPIPPLAEQKRIVAKIDAAFEKIEALKANAEKNLANAKELFQSSLDEAMRPKKGWVEKRLPDISENNDSKRVPITKSKRKSGTVPYYGASGIVDYVNDYIFDGSYLLVSEDGANLESRTYPIAFSISGKSWVNNHAHILKFEDADVQAYVELYLNSYSLKGYITGAAQPKLTQDNLNKIPINIPSSSSEIAKLVKQLKLIQKKSNALQQNYAQQIADCAEMRQAILREAFEGRL